MCEQRDLPCLLRLRKTTNVKRLIEKPLPDGTLYVLPAWSIADVASTSAP